MHSPGHGLEDFSTLKTELGAKNPHMGNVMGMKTAKSHGAGTTKCRSPTGQSGGGPDSNIDQQADLQPQARQQQQRQQRLRRDERRGSSPQTMPQSLGGEITEYPSPMREPGGAPDHHIDQQASLQPQAAQKQHELPMLSRHGQHGPSHQTMAIVQATGSRPKPGGDCNSSKPCEGSIDSRWLKSRQKRKEGRGQGLTSEAVSQKLQEQLQREKEEHELLKEHTESLRAKNRELQGKVSKMELEYAKISGSGSYNLKSASPTDVANAFRNIFPGVINFSTRLGKSMLEPKRIEMKDRYQGSRFLRNSHFPALNLTGEVSSILFEGFENESFIDGGYSQYLDPVQRKEKFFALFKANSHESDEDFLEYFRKRKARLASEFLGEQDSMSEQLEGLLDLEFRKAALNVWALHLVCFSFDPPACIFRVRRGAEFDRRYMETPHILEVDEDLLKNVAFMLVPGIRIDKFSTIKSSVYPVVEDLVTV